MSSETLNILLQKRDTTELKVQTLGQFLVWRHGHLIDHKDWGRDKTIQLFQFLITNRHKKGLHKEQIIDRLWGDLQGEVGDRDFKVALHGIHKTLEPSRKRGTDPRFVLRSGITYQLDQNLISIDARLLEDLVELGNEAWNRNQSLATKAYTEAVKLYQGAYLPERIFDDWCSEERERLQILALGAIINLAEIHVATTPMESIRLCHKALLIDRTWENAYRIQMQAYVNLGNRPQALKVYSECEQILEDEFGISPLPQTRQLLQEIENIV